MSRDIRLHQGDCLDVLKTLGENSIDSIVTDPPYGISLMNSHWDLQVPGPEVWRECLRVLKPGGHLLAFAGSRTQHRMCSSIEAAGFEIRDMLAWVYFSGFSKSRNLSKDIDRNGIENCDGGPRDQVRDRVQEKQYQSTAWMRSQGLTAKQLDLVTGSHMGSHYVTDKSQPSVPNRAHFELMRPLFKESPPLWLEDLVTERAGEKADFTGLCEREVIGEKTVTYSKNLGMAVQESKRKVVNVTKPASPDAVRWEGWGTALKPALEPITLARKPIDQNMVCTNLVAWGTGGLNTAACAVEVDGQPKVPSNFIHDASSEVDEILAGKSRLFYAPKASQKERHAGLAGFGPQGRNIHPTVKPVALMRYLCTLVTQPGGVVLDPFMGSGSTGCAAVEAGFSFVGIEREEEFFELAKARVDFFEKGCSED